MRFKSSGDIAAGKVAWSQYVLQMRVEAARRRLERTEAGLKQVASAVGFGSVDVMRRVFVRLLEITPHRYREFAGHSMCD